MRVYTIYEVKGDHRQFVIGRESLLEEMLGNGADGQPAHREDGREIRYLCRPISRDDVSETLMSRLDGRFPEMGREGEDLVFRHPVKGTIRIGFGPYSLSVGCEGTRMLDLDLFAGLAGSSGHYFAVKQGSRECGWLKPVRFWESGFVPVRELCGNSSR
ncbi:sporulation inhibitor of replication protein SirA [Edaphobacillus lindanitolerans]|uniref:Sporulation inhibitor of replication protein SirA n=1 Tax=Edaphobacillus lindanitolerans TaxID=550447 RepID=A0A1U7PJ08_9BACI|nr:sporulation inhibitor of replication protein SirA [Edaphobacillus lindanitolerans]SIT66888.1 Protein of unknown function [Edaphobacillus lindanitolerans]